MIKTFRGMMLTAEQDRIRLSTKKGKIGYQIKTFQVITKTPGAADAEYVAKIFKISQSSVSGTVDFSDGNLLGVAFISDANSIAYTGYETIIFDQEVFNQDIYVTMHEVGGSDVGCNYYLELETTTLTDNAAAVSTLRDIRLNPQKHA